MKKCHNCDIEIKSPLNIGRFCCEACCVEWWTNMIKLKTEDGVALMRYCLLGQGSKPDQD